MPGARLYGPKSHLGEQPHVPEPYCGLQASISESLSAPPVAMLVLVLNFVSARRLEAEQQRLALRRASTEKEDAS